MSARGAATNRPVRDNPLEIPVLLILNRTFSADRAAVRDAFPLRLQCQYTLANVPIRTGHSAIKTMAAEARTIPQVSNGSGATRLMASDKTTVSRGASAVIGATMMAFP